MTKDELEAAVAGGGSPCWVSLRSGDDLPCSSLSQVTTEFVSFETEKTRHLVRLVDVQSVRGDERKKGRKRAT